MSFRKNKKPFKSDAAISPASGNIDTDYLVAVKDDAEDRQEILRWLFSILAALLLYSVIAVITIAVYHPDTDALMAEAKDVLLQPDLAAPKPVEQLLFRLGVLTIIPGLWVFYSLFSKMKWVRPLARKPLFFLCFSVGCIVSLVLLAYFDFTALTLSGTGKRIPALKEGVVDTNFNFFFDGFFVGDYLWLYTLIVVPLVTCLFFIGFRKYQWDNSKLFRVIVPFLGYLVTGAIVLAIVVMNTFLYPYSNDNKYDFNAVYYSMTQVYAGVPMLAAGFSNTYGLYPHFLNPLFQLIGLNVFNFSLVMSILLGLSFVMNFYTVKKFVSNQVLLFLGFATMLFFSYLNRKMITQFDCYFALFPIRYIIPGTLLFLATRYFSRPSGILYWFTSFLSACFVLWNPEIGIVCYLSWIAVNLYTDFYSGDQGRVNVKKLLVHILGGIAILLMVFYTYWLLIYLFYGVSPDLSLLWKTISVFSKVGFMLLPMSLFNPWNIIALILVVGFLYSAVKWHKKAVTPKASIVLLLSLIGVGYLFYYEGRSHNVTLSVSSGFCLLLLTILGDELWQVIKTKSVFVLNAFFVGFLFLVSFSFIELIFNADRIYSMVWQEEDKAIGEGEKETLEAGREFILNNTVEGQKILLLTASKFQGLHFDGNKIASAFNPGIIDMHLNTDFERYQDMIRDSAFTIFIEPIYFYFPHMQRVAAEVATLYEYRMTRRAMALLRKRRFALPSATFFRKGYQSGIHRKYRDDTTGLRYRINDAFGTVPLRLDTEFSVQMLFFVQPQIYRSATIIGNLNDDSKGFSIRNEFNSTYYHFCINDQSFKVQLNYNQWCYAVMNVYADHMDVYVNGAVAGSVSLSQPIAQSANRLTIGNLGKYQSYYVGAISEVGVENQVIPQETIKETWGRIESVIGR